MSGSIVSPARVVILAGVTAALHVGKLPPALPVLRDALGVSLLQAGFLLSLVQVAGMTLALLVGLAVDGVGLRRSVLAGLWILSAASAIGGWANAASDLLWLRAIEGFGFLLVALPAPGLIRRLVPPERLSRDLGLWGAYMPFGTALALLAGPWVMSALNWRGWWWSLAALSAGMALATLLGVQPDRPRRDAGNAGRTRRTSAPPRDRDGWIQRLRATLAAPGPWMVALSFAMYSGQWLAVIGFLPSIYYDAGLGGRTAGALTALASLVNVLGNIGSGRLLHRGFRPMHLLHVGFVAMALGATLAFALPGASPLARYFGVLMFSAVGGLVPGTLFSLAVRVAPSERTVSTTVGWMQQFSSLGQFVGPPVVAWVAGAAGGWQWTWVVTGSCSLAGVLLAAAIKRVQPG